jgi:hypothetical protein
MELRFYEDPETGEPHIYNHGITEDEVRQVLAHPGERPAKFRRLAHGIWPNARRPLPACDLCAG